MRIVAAGPREDTTIVAGARWYWISRLQALAQGGEHDY